MKNRLLSVGLIITSVGLGTGCTPKYVQPTSELAAQIRFRVADQGYFAMIHTYERAGCQGPQAIGLIGGPSFVKVDGDPERVRPEMIGSSGQPDPQRIETVVRAGQPFTVLYSQIGPHDSKYVRTCALPVTFLPKSGEQYEVLYQYDTKSCFVGVSRLTAEGGQIQHAAVEGVAKEQAACSPYKF